MRPLSLIRGSDIEFRSVLHQYTEYDAAPVPLAAVQTVQAPMEQRLGRARIAVATIRVLIYCVLQSDGTALQYARQCTQSAFNAGCEWISRIFDNIQQCESVYAEYYVCY